MDDSNNSRYQATTRESLLLDFTKRPTEGYARVNEEEWWIFTTRQKFEQFEQQLGLHLFDRQFFRCDPVDIQRLQPVTPPPSVTSSTTGSRTIPNYTGKVNVGMTVVIASLNGEMKPSRVVASEVSLHQDSGIGILMEKESLVVDESRVFVKTDNAENPWCHLGVLQLLMVNCLWQNQGSGQLASMGIVKRCRQEDDHEEGFPTPDFTKIPSLQTQFDVSPYYNPLGEQEGSLFYFHAFNVSAIDRILKVNVWTTTTTTTTRTTMRFLFYPNYIR